MLVPYTTRPSATPGQITRCGASNMWKRTCPLSIAPQLGVGGPRPKPRKLSPASARIIPGTLPVKATMVGARMLGRTWRSSIRSVPLPMAVAAARYMSSLMRITVLRISREPTIPPSDRMNIIAGIEVPVMDTITSRMLRPGMHIHASTKR